MCRCLKSKQETYCECERRQGPRYRCSGRDTRGIALWWHTARAAHGSHPSHPTGCTRPGSPATGNPWSQIIPND